MFFHLSSVSIFLFTHLVNNTQLHARSIHKDPLSTEKRAVLLYYHSPEHSIHSNSSLIIHLDSLRNLSTVLTYLLSLSTHINSNNNHYYDIKRMTILSLL